jgi:hypothetical protein
MPEFGPLAPIVGAIVGATIASLVGYFILQKRKRVKFWVSKSDDVTLPLRRDHKHIVFQIGGRNFVNLNRAMVFVKNVGNTAISGFKFDIEIPDQHQEYLAELIVDDSELRKAIKLEWNELKITTNPRCHVHVAPFFNMEEGFEVLL